MAKDHVSRRGNVLHWLFFARPAGRSAGSAPSMPIGGFKVGEAGCRRLNRGLSAARVVGRLKQQRSWLSQDLVNARIKTIR